MRLAPWLRLVLTVGLIKLAGTTLGILAKGLPWWGPGAGLYKTPPALDYSLIIAFGLGAAFLVVLGRGDRRAVSLGGFFLCLGAAFCTRWLKVLADDVDFRAAAVGLDSLKVDALIAYFFWRFVSDFPRVAEPPWLKLALRIGTRTSLVIGALWAAINFVVRLLAFQGVAVHPALRYFAPQAGRGIYHGFLMSLTAVALGLLVVKARSAQGEERRRVALFTLGVVGGLGPILVEILCELSPTSYTEFMTSHTEVSRPLGTVLLALVLTVPFTTAYSVLVHRVLDLKLLARKAVHYGLARYSILALVSVPVVLLSFYFYSNRDQRLAEILSGGRAFLLLGLAALGIVALRYRHRMLDAIDRRFFREHYDARHILTLLVERIRSINETSTLANLVSREIDLALHLEDISMMVLDPRSGVLNDPRSRARRLDASTQVALTVSNASDPLEIDLEDPRSPLQKLPEAERHWLVDSGFRLIVPILARDGSLLGMVGLGEKKSGLPFMKEDLQLLHAIASSAAWVLELDLGRQLGGQSTWRPAADGEAPDRARLQLASELAKECSHCGTVYMGYVVFCSRCSRKLEQTKVPYVLPGKFRFEKRIGVGGMGIVYRGADLALGRHVALKTLRRVSPEDALRLRREARAAAAVTHPHLAAVYGLETWQGTPFLVMELLEGGTLADRIEQGALPVQETVELGVAMAAALAHLHAADILHRDIKPSNIGFTRDGVGKLMDFGIARMVFDLDREGRILPDTDGELATGSTWQPGESASRLVGTLAYLSPEALDGESPDPSFDLWGLGVVLYECLLGRKLFAGGDAQQVMSRIRAARLPDLPPSAAPHEGALAELFRHLLNRSRSRRPATALELRKRLLALA